MNLALTIKLCKAVRDHLDGATYSIAFEPRRSYWRKVDVRDLEKRKGPDVLVMPSEVDRDLEADWATRGGPGDTVHVDVAFRAKLEAATVEAIDPLVELVEEVQRDLLGDRVIGFEGMVCNQARIVPVFSPDHLEDQGVFFSVLRLRFIGAV